MRYLWPILLFLLLPAKSQALPQIVDHCKSAVSGAGSASCTVHNIINNDMIAVVFSSCGPLVPGSDMSDTFGIGWTTTATILGFSVSSCNFRNHTLNINYACVGGNSGNDTVSQANNGVVGYSPAIIVAVFRGVVCSTDGSATTNNAIANSTGVQSAGNITTTQVYDLVVGGALVNGSPTFIDFSPQAGPGFLFVDSILTDWGGNDCVGGACQCYMSMEWKAVAVASTFAVNFTFQAGNNLSNAGAVGRAFGPGTGPPVRHRTKEIKYVVRDRNRGIYARQIVRQ